MDSKTIKLLDSMTIEELTEYQQNRRLATVKEDIDTFLKVDGEQSERLARIRVVDAEWKAPTNGDRIVSFLTTKGASTKTEIIKGTGITSGVWLTLKNLVDGGRITLDQKTEKYSVVKGK